MCFDRKILFAMFSSLLIFSIPAQAGITVSPSNLSVTYTGTVRLSASVSTGATADVDLFFDLNRNGSINSDDFVFRHYTVKDQSMVPPDGALFVADSDGAANGMINIPILNFPDEAIASQMIARVKSGSSTNQAIFTVSGVSGSQSVAGKIMLSGTTAKAGAVLLMDNSGEVLYGVMSDSAGQYTVTFASAGSYLLSAMIVGEVQDFSLARTVSLSPGQNKTNFDLTVAHAPYRWSGKIIRSDTSAGLPYLWFGAEAKDGQQMRIMGSTDANGNFDVAIPTGSWMADASDAAVARGAQNGIMHDDETPLVVGSKSVTGKTYSFDPIIGFVFGRARNAQTLGWMPNVSFRASPGGSNDETAVARTNSNGSFALGLTAGTWDIRPSIDDDQDIRNTMLVPAVTYTKTISLAQTGQDIGIVDCRLGDGSVRVRVADPMDAPLAEVYAFGMDQGISKPYQSGSFTTDADGTALLPIRTNGSWHIGVWLPETGEAPPSHRLDVLADDCNTFRIYPSNYRRRPYRVYGGSSLPANGAYPQDSGFTLLGQATGNHNFKGSYSYYYIVAYDGQVMIDSIRGFNGPNYGPSASGAAANTDRINGSPDGQFALVGDDNGRPVVGYVGIHPATKPEGIAVYHPDDARSDARRWNLFR